MSISVLGTDVNVSEKQQAALEMLQGNPANIGGDMQSLMDMSAEWAKTQPLSNEPLYDGAIDRVLRYVRVSGILALQDLPVGLTSLTWTRKQGRFSPKGATHAIVAQVVEPGVVEGRAYRIWTPDMEKSSRVKLSLGGAFNSVSFRNLLDTPEQWPDVGLSNFDVDHAFVEDNQVEFDEADLDTEGPLPWTLGHPLADGFINALVGLAADAAVQAGQSTPETAKRYAEAYPLYTRTRTNAMKMPTACVAVPQPVDPLFEPFARSVGDQKFLPYQAFLVPPLRGLHPSETVLTKTKKTRAGKVSQELLVSLDFEGVPHNQVWGAIPANVKNDDTRSWDLVRMVDFRNESYQRNARGDFEPRWQNWLRRLQEAISAPPNPGYDHGPGGRVANAEALFAEHCGYQFFGNQYGNNFLTEHQKTLDRQNQEARRANWKNRS